jgi:DNA-binding winged helix-turn-helix (wHTH) protein
MVVALAHSGPAGPTLYTVDLEAGTSIVLNTGEVSRADGAHSILCGQPLVVLIALVEAHGLPVSEATFQTHYGVADPRKVISVLRRALADPGDAPYYVVNVRGRGWRLANYELEIEELPSLDISSALMPVPLSWSWKPSA